MMLRRITMVLVLIVLLVTAVTAGAQEEAGWYVVLATQETHTLSWVGSTGVIKEVTIPELEQFSAIYGYKFSPDETKLAFVGVTNSADGSSSTSYAYVADLSTGVCCLPLVDPLNSIMDSAMLGSFSPDGTQVAVLLTSNAMLGTDTPVEGLVSTFDVTTGIVTGNLGVYSLAYNGELPPQGAQIGAWLADGVRVVASCLGCEVPLEGFFQIWDPATGALSDPVEPYNYLRHILVSTGEGIAYAQDQRFDFNSAADTMFPNANVVEYYPDAMVGNDKQVIYFNPNNVNIAYSGGWAVNGEAVVIQHNDPNNTFSALPEVVLLSRDGTTQTVPTGANQTFIAGAPDGWLMLDYSTSTLYFYQVQDGQVTPTQIFQGQGFPQLIVSPVLGAPSNPSPFPAVQ